MAFALYTNSALETHTRWRSHRRQSNADTRRRTSSVPAEDILRPVEPTHELNESVRAIRLHEHSESSRIERGNAAELEGKRKHSLAYRNGGAYSKSRRIEEMKKAAALITLRLFDFARDWNYTRRRFGGRQPLCGTGVTSRIKVTLNPLV